MALGNVPFLDLDQNFGIIQKNLNLNIFLTEVFEKSHDVTIGCCYWMLLLDIAIGCCYWILPLDVTIGYCP